MSKRETVEEFLARGGAITVCPKPEEVEKEDNRVSPMMSTGSSMMTLSEGSLFYSESRAKPKSRKPSKKTEINFAVLPACLQKYNIV